MHTWTGWNTKWKDNPPFFLLSSLPHCILVLSIQVFFFFFYTFRSMNNSSQSPTKIHALRNVTHLSNPVLDFLPAREDVLHTEEAPTFHFHVVFPVSSWHLAHILEHPYLPNHSHLQSHLLAVLQCIRSDLHFMLSFLTPWPLSSFQGRDS